MKQLILLLIPLFSMAQPDITKAYLTGSKPKKAIRFFDNGTFVEHTYDKPILPKGPSKPIEKIDSGTYRVNRFGILLKGKIPRLMRFDDKRKDIYTGLFKPKRLRRSESELYPTVSEWERYEWIRKNHELYINQSQEYIKRKAILSINKWCPEYMLLVDSSYCGPGCYNSLIKGKTILYDGDTTLSFPKELNTLLHESTHHYNKVKWDYEKEYTHRYMITPGHELWARHTKMYRSCEFIAMVPKDAPSRIFRYGTYVGVGSDVGANEWGIYGLMDEFSAYYNGTRGDWIGYQAAKTKNDKKSMEIFESGCLSTYFAWYEFRTFTGWYMTYAKLKYPDIYKVIMENREIAKVFSELDIEFAELVGKIEKEFAGKWVIESHERDYVSYLRPIMKGLEPILTEFKSKPQEPPKKISKKKK